MNSISEDAGKGKSRRPEFLTNRFMFILAGVIVLAIVGSTIAVSSVNASLAAQKAAEQEASQAVSEFEKATIACKKVNATLSKAETDAATVVTTDPLSLADPTLIDALKATTSENSATHTCAAPAMAATTDEIATQTASLQAEIDDVSVAARSLQSAADAVTASVQAKVAADAAAAAAEAAKAAAAARTWHEDGGNGYTYDVSLVAGEPTTGATGSGSTVGSVCTDFNPATDIAVPYTLTVTSTTKSFAIPSLSVALYPYGVKGVNLASGSWYTGSNLFSATDIGTYEAEEFYSGNGSKCWQPGQSLSAGLLNVQWSSGLEAGATSTWNFNFIVKGYKNPSHPDGNPALLSGIALSPELLIFWTSSAKAIALDNTIIGG
jgi:hypothetical protein